MANINEDHADILVAPEDEAITNGYPESAHLLTKHTNKKDIIRVLVFACLGNIIVQTARIYPSGFFVQYTEEKSLNTTFGTVAVSAALATSALATYIIRALPMGLQSRLTGASLSIRCLVLCLVNCVCCALVAILQPLLDWDSTGSAGFGILLVVRAIQGVSIGLLFVLVQGELVDLYLKEHKVLIVIVSGSMHCATIVASVMGAELYVAGGWTFVGPGVAVFSLLPLLALPWVVRIQNTERTMKDGDGIQGRNTETSLSLLRKLAFFMPDVAMFHNNLAFNFLIFVIPVSAMILFCRTLI